MDGDARIPSDTGMIGYYLDYLNVLSLPALRAFGHFELHRLPFLQTAKAACLNSGETHEDIFTSLTADKAVCVERNEEAKDPLPQISDAGGIRDCCYLTRRNYNLSLHVHLCCLPGRQPRLLARILRRRNSTGSVSRYSRVNY